MSNTTKINIELQGVYIDLIVNDEMRISNPIDILLKLVELLKNRDPVISEFSLKDHIILETENIKIKTQTLSATIIA
jgi:hypothetical protein